MKKMALKLVRDFIEQQQLNQREPLGVVYSPGFEDEIRSEVEKIAMKMGFQEILWVQTGGVISTHSGPGDFGIGGFSKKV